MSSDSSPLRCARVLDPGLGVNFGPCLTSLLRCMSVKKIYKNIRSNSNVAGSAVRDETKLNK